MDCRQALNLMDGCLDGELEPARRDEVERHVADCPACREAFATRGALSGAIRANATYHTAPAATAARVRAALDHGGAIAGAAPKLPSRWLALAASAAFAAVLGSGVTYWYAQPSPAQRLAQQAIASHVRSLMVVGRSTDVSSSDQHTVKPWFNGRLDFSPPVIDLTAQGFALVGGRLDYLDNRPVAALVYRHRQHVVDLFIWPAEKPLAAAAVRTGAQRGYHLFYWSDASMNYWVVSDLNPDDLRTFTGLIREHVAPRGRT